MVVGTPSRRQEIKAWLEQGLPDGGPRRDVGLLSVGHVK